MSEENEFCGVEIDETTVELSELDEAALENVSGGLVFTFKLVAVKTVSWS